MRYESQYELIKGNNYKRLLISFLIFSMRTTLPKEFTMTRFIIALSTLFLLSCGSGNQKHSEETLHTLSKTMNKTGHYISGNFLRYYGPKDLPEEEEKQLLAAFKSFLSHYNHVNSEYRNIMAVKQFLAIHLNTIQDYKEKRTAGEFSGDSPLAVANALIFATGIDLNNLDDSASLKRGAKMLSITEEQAVYGIYYLITHSQNEVMGKLHTEMHKQLKLNKNREAIPFAQNILLPSLTMLSSGVDLDAVLVNYSSRAFNTIFQVEGEEIGDPLIEMIDNFRDYLQGGALKAKYLTTVNNHMLKKGLYLKMDRNYCGLLEVVDYFEINHPALSRIQILSEFELTRSNSMLGDAVYREQSVNLYRNSIDDQVSKIVLQKQSEKSDSLLISQLSMWQIKSSFTPDSLIRSVYKRDFQSLDSAAVNRALVKKVALHEAKHAWDAQFDTTERKRRVFDVEVSAHLTESILTEIPHYALCKTVQRFNRHRNVPELEKPIRDLNRDIISLLEESLNGSMDDKEFRSGILEIYTNYRDRDGLPFPEFEKFKSEVGLKVLEI